MNEPTEIRQLPDDQAETWRAGRANLQERFRARLGLVPVPAQPDPSRYLCGCPRDPAVGPSRVDDEGGCTVCEVRS